jgi:hypothetical protein
MFMKTKKIIFYSLLIASASTIKLLAMEESLVTHDIIYEKGNRRLLLTFKGTTDQIEVAKACNKIEGSVSDIMPFLEKMTKETINRPVKVWARNKPLSDDKAEQSQPDFKDITLLKWCFKAAILNLPKYNKLDSLPSNAQDLEEIMTPYQKNLFSALQQHGAQDNFLWQILGWSIFQEAVPKVYMCSTKEPALSFW